MGHRDSGERRQGRFKRRPTSGQGRAAELDCESRGLELENVQFSLQAGNDRTTKMKV